MTDTILTEALEIFDQAQEAEAENRRLALDDLKFARMADQWDEQIRKDRARDGRPCLTVNRLPSFIRQVVNDARLNKPQIRVRPVDGGADVNTADVMNGLIRNIEQASNADVAYDTAADFAVTMGFGYFRVDVDFAHDDTFDQDIRIERIANPFSVYGDPFSTAADSSDWNHGFITTVLPRERFEAKYPGAEAVDFRDLPQSSAHHWLNEDEVTVAEYWRREEVDRKVLQLSNGMVIDEDAFENAKRFFEAQIIEPVRERLVTSHKVTHRIMSGVEVIEETEWAGRFIPIVPVYGDEVNVEGRRWFHSLIRDAKDAQRMFNYWRTTSTELVALAPKAPFIGPKGFAKTDRDKWESANTVNWPYLEYDGAVPPQRQPFDGVPAGALQEALNANDDMKAIMGLHDASLGAPSNEISGVAIAARQREGDVSTFHFIDNLSRAIRHAGRVIVDLIPMVYTGRRVVRVLGQDGTPAEAQLAPFPGDALQAEARGNWANEIFDLSVGKYDLAVDAGPSFTTRREEAASQMLDLVRVFPAAAPIIGDLLVKNLDWPGADEIAERLQTLVPQLTGAADAPDPRLAALEALVQQLQDALAAALQSQNIEQAKLAIDRFEAETQRLKVLGEQRQNAAELAQQAREQAARAVQGFVG